MGPPPQESGHPWATGVLGVGFLALLIAVVAAATDPATGFELSLYRSTSPVYWAGLGVALGAALLITARGPDTRWLLGGTFVLAYTGFLSFVALPRIRGYHYLGAGDSLTHLGWVTEFAAGRVDPLTFLYPAVHLTALVTNRLLGLSLPATMELVVLLYLALFLLFVPLCAYRLYPAGRTALLGLFAAGLFLPINTLSVHRMIHAFSLAVFFFPLVLYLLLAHVDAGRSSNGARRELALALASVALVLVHPQLGVGLVFALVALTGFQWVVGRLWPGHAVASHGSLVVPAVVVAGFYLLWVGNKPPVEALVVSIVDSLSTGVFVGDEVAQRASSTESVGVNVKVMVVKLFGATAVFTGLAGIAVLGFLRDWWNRDWLGGTALVPYVLVATLPLVGIFVVLFVSSVGDFYMRYFGALAIVATLLGTRALARVTGWRPTRRSGRTIRAGVVVLLAVLLVLSLLTVYPSPYVLRGSGHVTEQRLGGYESAFETRAEGTPWVGIRSGVERPAHGIYGPPDASRVREFRRSKMVPPAVFETNLTSHYDSPHYLPVTAASVQVETQLYDGFRYGRAGFRTLETSPRVDRVRTNGEFRLYLLGRG